MMYADQYGGGGSDQQQQAAAASLRRRNVEATALSPPTNGRGAGGGGPYQEFRRTPKEVVKKLDFMFPKVDQEYQVTTDGGGIASIVAYSLIVVLIFAEIAAWSSQNSSTSEHISVDTSLGKRMSVNLNITFPALACEDLHIDVMDVAGDSQLNIEDTMVKRRLTLKGVPMSAEEKVESNKYKKEQSKKEEVINKELPDNYCGPCYGAQEKDDQCCQTCDDLIAAYQKKKWRTDVVIPSAEQCIREGRDKKEPKRMKKGEGCNLSGSMKLNRVAGNFHIAMGEGIERDGRHIHTFVPEDTPNFNASHIIHHLSFGNPDVASWADSPLEKVTKIVKKEHGTTGLFQYFIKVVPTTLVGKGKGGTRIETNRYFFTERFRPLMQDYDEAHDDHVTTEYDDVADSGDEEKKLERKAARAGHAGGHSQQDHHHIRNAILPGVFFIYEIYPFSVEVTENSVPLTHLLIRIMATVGGVFVVVRWADAAFFERIGKKRQSMS